MLTLKYKDKPNKTMEPNYVVIPSGKDSAYIRLNDERKLSEIASDFEDLIGMVNEDQDISLFTKLTKIYRENVGNYVMVIMKQWFQ